ncbi:hypothetical protein L596_002248 [Steinernema carpocapsae]|uniref:Uncharacterized protein n=1 Tax=Steinernema carpocapsae TaxID=34508 RepID=A0A4V6I7L6_STECR|nr:hypothetical protein L596_002248 [Steinernema carpocapsae]
MSTARKATMKDVLCFLCTIQYTASNGEKKSEAKVSITESSAFRFPTYSELVAVAWYRASPIGENLIK